LIKSFL
jgi:trehalose/maltose hydrolase-like predicted phosphorylase